MTMVRPLSRESLEDLDHDLAVLRVEVAGGLVGEDDARVVGDGARDRHALLLAAGELARARVRQLAETQIASSTSRA